MEKIYLDFAATTYVRDEVLEAMMPYFKKYFGNPSSLYSSGREAKAVLENARTTIAGILNAKFKNEIYFTSCGTESDNWAIKGLVKASGKKHIITSKVEHHAIIDTAKYMEAQGCEVTYLDVDEYGMVCPKQVEDAIREDTAVVSIVYANNEVGSINPIKEIGAICRKKGVPFHTDAVQGVGHLNIDVQLENIDLLSASAHKFYGPKGVGLLYVRNGIKIERSLCGGAQERKKRAGTENIAEICGMAKALELCAFEMESENKRLSELRDYMIKEVLEKVPYTHLNGHPQKRLANNVNISLEFIESEASLLSLDLAGVECSSGSACASGSLESSHVLMAMGVPAEIAKGALRFTFGQSTTKEQIDFTINQIQLLSERLRKISPLFIKRQKEQ